jgi:hypothetical protein
LRKANLFFKKLVLFAFENWDIKTWDREIEKQDSNSDPVITTSLPKVKKFQ